MTAINKYFCSIFKLKKLPPPPKKKFHESMTKTLHFSKTEILSERYKNIIIYNSCDNVTEACWQKLCRGWSICINKTIFISAKFPLSWSLMNIQIDQSEKGLFKECVNNIHFHPHFSNFSHMLRSRWRIRRYSNLLQATERWRGSPKYFIASFRRKNKFTWKHGRWPEPYYHRERGFFVFTTRKINNCMCICIDIILEALGTSNGDFSM